MLARIEAICVAPAASVGMVALQQVEAIAGVGLDGDRYAQQIGYYSPRPTDPGAREVTLIEGEALDELRERHGIELNVAEHRRNLTTRGIRLKELIGQKFRIGDVLLEGVRDCPPCEHLQGLVNKPVLQPLVNCGGIRARVVKGGTLRVGDEVDILRSLHQEPVAR